MPEVLRKTQIQSRKFDLVWPVQIEHNSWVTCSVNTKKVTFLAPICSPESVGLSLRRGCFALLHDWFITSASNQKNSRLHIKKMHLNTANQHQFQHDNEENSITKGYKEGWQWNWHFSKGFWSGKQISTAREELKTKQNFWYHTQESLFSVWQAADGLCGPVGGGWGLIERAVGARGDKARDSKKPKCHPHKLLWKKGSFFLPLLLNSKKTELLWRRVCVFSLTITAAHLI